MFIDLWNAMLTPDGQPREDLWVEDRIHPNHEGYLIRVRIMRPLLGPPDRPRPGSIGHCACSRSSTSSWSWTSSRPSHARSSPSASIATRTRPSTPGRSRCSRLSLVDYAATPVNVSRVIALLLVHDIGEIDTGDTMVFIDEGLAAARPRNGRLSSASSACCRRRARRSSCRCGRNSRTRRRPRPASRMRSIARCRCCSTSTTTARAGARTASPTSASWPVSVRRSRPAVPRSWAYLKAASRCGERRGVVWNGNLFPCPNPELIPGPDGLRPVGHDLDQLLGAHLAAGLVAPGSDARAGLDVEDLAGGGVGVACRRC